MQFNIVNHTKCDSLFNYGMRVLVSSSVDPVGGWRRGGHNFSYYQNNFKREGTARSLYYYSLSFTYNF